MGAKPNQTHLNSALVFFYNLHYINLTHILIVRKLKNCKLDPHLLPYNVNCAPCNVDYKVVVKLENLAQDLPFVGEMAGVQFEMVANLNPSSGKTSELAKEYFSQIHQQDVEKLNQLYKFDFELFDYDPDIYFTFAKD